MSSTPPRVLFYCQYLLGLGHLTRSLALCEALAEDMEVDFISGGPPVDRKIRSPRLHMHQIEPLLMREVDSSLYSPEGKDVAEVFTTRERQLHGLLEKNRHRAFITELFPFGRGKFKNEIIPLIRKFRELNPGAPVLSSVRDILVEREGQAEKERKMAEMARDHYDLVLVHSDDEVVTLDRTFPPIEIIQEKLRYTGFVTEGRPSMMTKIWRKQEVLVSLGGGSVGQELIEAVLKTAPLLPDLVFRIKRSPYFPASAHALLDQAASEQIRIEPFSTDFEADLREVALSISMGGYNTVMNVLNTSTPALIWSYDANHEQRLRGELLKEKGYLDLIEQEDLDRPEVFAKKIRARLESNYPAKSLNLSGGENTARILKSLFE